MRVTRTSRNSRTTRARCTAGHPIRDVRGCESCDVAASQGPRKTETPGEVFTAPATLGDSLRSPGGSGEHHGEHRQRLVCKMTRPKVCIRSLYSMKTSPAQELEPRANLRRSQFQGRQSFIQPTMVRSSLHGHPQLGGRLWNPIQKDRSVGGRDSRHWDHESKGSGKDTPHGRERVVATAGRERQSGLTEQG